MARDEQSGRNVGYADVDISRTEETGNYENGRGQYIAIRATYPKDFPGYKIYTHTPTSGYYIGGVNYRRIEQKGLDGIKGGGYLDSCVYYWRHDDGNLVPLLLGFVKEKEKEARFYLDKESHITSNIWTEEGYMTKESTLARLAAISNGLERVVVLKTDALNDKYGVSGESTTPINPGIWITVEPHSNSLNGFISFIHRLSIGSMIILSTRDVSGFMHFRESQLNRWYSRVVVYYWSVDTACTRPLVLELVSSEGSKASRYYKREGNEWVMDSTIRSETLQESLDKLNCALNGAVPVDIGKIGPKPYCCTPHCPRMETNGIRVSSTTLREDPSYITYTHYSKHNVSRFMNGHYKLWLYGLGFPLCDARVSVYYWEPLEAPPGGTRGQPLLIKIERNVTESISSTKTIEFYENDGSDTWQKCNMAGTYTLLDKLEVLNCTLNRVAAINLTKKPSNDPKVPTTYCHETVWYWSDKKHYILLKVEKWPLSYKDFVAHRHSTNDALEFNISGFKTESGRVISAGLQVLSADSVLVYYWSGDNGRDKPLLLEVYKGEDPLVCFLCERNGMWKRCDPFGAELQNELIRQNCKLYGVTRIDPFVMSGSANYCHQVCSPEDKIVTVVQSHETEKYTVYCHNHKMSSSGRRLTVRGFKGSGNVAPLELPNPFWNADRVYTVWYPTGKRAAPLLIYCSLDKGSPENKWYKVNSDYTLVEIAKDEGPPSDEMDVDTILKLLVELYIPSVVVNIRSAFIELDETALQIDPGGSNEKVTFVRDIVELDYSKFCYGVADVSRFRACQFMYDEMPIHGIPTSHILTEVAVYYANTDVECSNPLLIKLVISAPKTEYAYYVKDGDFTHWKLVYKEAGDIIKPLEEFVNNDPKGIKIKYMSCKATSKLAEILLGVGLGGFVGHEAAALGSRPKESLIMKFVGLFKRFFS